MAIIMNVVSVQCNGGFLRDMVLLTLWYYHQGTRLNAMKRSSLWYNHQGTRLNAMRRSCLDSLCSHLNVLTLFPSPPCLGDAQRFRCVSSDFL